MNNCYQAYRIDKESSAACTGLTRFTAKPFTVRRIFYAAFLGGAMVLGWSLVYEPSLDPPDSVSKSATPLPNVHSKYPVDLKVQRAVDSGRERQSAKSTSSFLIPANSLIHGLLVFGENDAMTEHQLQSVKSTLTDLAQMGVKAVTDIRDFLDSREDVLFRAENGVALEYSSLRLALIDALRQIGGFEAEQVLLEQLIANVTVAELAAIADGLEWLQPGFYTESILAVAGERLAGLSATSAPEERTESGPLFRILQNYGNEDVATILYQAPYWFQDYAQLALANLPDGLGIAGLSQRVGRDLQSPQGGRGLHLIAQVALVEPQAEKILLGLVQSDQVPEVLWPMIGEVLMGDRQLQIETPSLMPESIGSLRGDNPYAIQTTVDRQVQIVYSVNYSAVLSAEEVTARLGLISRLMNETSNPAAISALWDARATLEDHYWYWTFSE